MRDESNHPSPGAAAPAPAAPLRRSVHILAGTAVLVLMYFGREILVPLTLAAILSLIMAPLVRAFKRCRFGRVASVLAAVSLVTIVLGGIAFAIVLQVVAMGQRLPEYEQTLRTKAQTLQTATLGRIEALQGEAGKIFGQLTDGPDNPDLSFDKPLNLERSRTPIPVELHEPPASAVTVVSRLASSIWGPIGTASIVIITLIFALLEHESLRDRFIRLTGSADLRATTQAMDDAGDRLSRYFLSQLAVNASVGVVVGIGLALVGVPQALLWAAVTALLRFVPYVGIIVAAGSTSLFAAAVDPSWSLCLVCLALFVAVEIIVSQVVEPLLYGHSTGLSPISIVIAAVFWSWLWGPIGLLLSTPLTLCLVVAGRNFKGLELLDILFGDTPALSLTERFYQRALAGDAEELLVDAHAYLNRKSLAKYCDEVLTPAFHLARADFVAGTISPKQQHNVRSSIATLLTMIGPEAQRPARRRSANSVLDQAGLGAELRRQREAKLGAWQGPLEVPPGSVALCVGLGSLQDDADTEILVRVLRDIGIDARHVSMAQFDTPPPNARPEAVAIVFVVCMSADQDFKRSADLAAKLRDRLTGVPLVGMLPAGRLLPEQFELAKQTFDATVHTFEAAADRARARFAPS